MPQFGRLQIPGAEAVFYANFAENIVGLLRPHVRFVIVAGRAAAIVDASANNSSLWPRLVPELNGLLHTMRVDTASAPPSVNDGPGPAGLTIAGLLGRSAQGPCMAVYQSRRENALSRPSDAGSRNYSSEVQQLSVLLLSD
ncbi:MAG: hypothetical protein ACR2JB_07890 [Bryobacteraceae bacterium]